MISELKRATSESNEEVENEKREALTLVAPTSEANAVLTRNPEIGGTLLPRNLRADAYGIRGSRGFRLLG